MFCSRYSSVGADQMVLSSVLGTLGSGLSALNGIIENKMLSQGDYADWMTYKTCQKINGA
jgi:hypothetical protein